MGVFRFYGTPVGTRGNAVLNWGAEPMEDIVAYAHCYRNAAQALMHLEDRREHDEVGYAACPIIFIYRHALELYLKAMIYRAARISVSDSELLDMVPRLWREHSLTRLIDMASPILEVLEQRLSPSLLATKGEVWDWIGELDAVDPGSYVFRYPVTVGGAASLPSTAIVNIFEFARHADAALDHLNQMCIYLREAIPPSTQMRLALNPIVVKERKKPK